MLLTKLSISEFADRLSEIMPALTREFARHQTEEFYKMKVTMPQFVVMEILHRNDEIKMTDLARSMNVSTAAMTGIIDRLVRERYVIRSSDPKDRRIINVGLTEKGCKILKKIISLRKQMLIKVFGIISQKEREDYLNILSHIRDHLRE